MNRGRSNHITTIKSTRRRKPDPERIESGIAPFFHKLLSSSFERLNSPVCPKNTHFFKEAKWPMRNGNTLVSNVYFLLN
jgi:hypothetical protein